MGIHDRDYVFSRSARLGRNNPFSVNTWIILINAVVFFGGFMLSGFGIPVFQTTTVARQYDGLSVKPVGPYLAQPLGPPASAADQHRVNAVLYRQLVDASSNQPIDGVALYTVELPLHALGHFSTFLGVFKLEVWRLITFQFLHAGIMHLAFNMLGLYMFGSMVEQYLGSRRYLAFYLTCGIFGGLSYLLLNLLGYIAQHLGWNSIPGLLYNASTTPLIGASAGVFGVIVACAYISPHSIVQLLFPPIPMKLRTMAYLYVGIAAATVLFGGKNAGGEAAHLGGAFAGFFLIRNSHWLRDFFDVFSDSRKIDPRHQRPDASSAPPHRRDPFPDNAELDRILAKVRDQGLHSLSDAERTTLRRATERRQASG